MLAKYERHTDTVQWLHFDSPWAATTPLACVWVCGWGGWDVDGGRPTLKTFLLQRKELCTVDWLLWAWDSGCTAIWCVWGVSPYPSQLLWSLCNKIFPNPIVLTGRLASIYMHNHPRKQHSTRALVRPHDCINLRGKQDFIFKLLEMLSDN